ncbi:hypothetical protein LOC71_20710 [Rhodopirellula sp. JC740]|uniref:Uncharacterized protein n=1 Tax=Rhodopirellula halodulae TaxID=2894198 RepID=A0ABS8NME1_9BACT|nr:hypothetical protein [Rhodopirellula sp. JC740]MCC9644702.1 hypothetical protein [Rhodopirellula sp. JC740]
MSLDVNFMSHLRSSAFVRAADRLDFSRNGCSIERIGFLIDTRYYQEILPVRRPAMTDNPYESSTVLSPGAVRSSSLRAHWFVSAFILGCWAITLWWVYASDDVSLQDGDIVFQFTSSSSNTTSMGDITVTSHAFFINRDFAVGLLLGGLFLTLVVVNIGIAWWRRRTNADV